MLLFKIGSVGPVDQQINLVSPYHPKIIVDIHKMYKKQVSLNVIIMINDNENEADNENSLQRYDINKPRSRHEHKYMKYKTVSV